jgi:YfiH family protein
MLTTSPTDLKWVIDLKWVREDTTYFQFPRLSLNPHLMHGVFTRKGGVSASPFDSLNTSFSVDDQPEDVAANLRKIKDTIGAQDLIHMNQVHGNDILVVDQSDPDSLNKSFFADAMITNMPQVALLVKQADCQGTIIYDPKKHVLANVHCGWRGNVQDILGRVATRMKGEFGCKASDLEAAIGPSLGPCCAEFVTYRDIFPEVFDSFMVNENHFDLWALSSWQLENAGMRPENIEVAGLCTRCRTDLFYSYRAEGNTGRFGTVAMLR